MNSWKVIKDGWMIAEDSDIRLVMHIVKNLDEKVRVDIDFNTREITVISTNLNFTRSEQIKKGIKENQIKKFRRYPNFIEDPDYKFCTGCKTSFKLDKFGFDRKSSDGRNRRCKQCVNGEAKKRYKKRKGDKR